MPGIIRMQMVAAVKGRQEACRMPGTMGCPILIDDGIAATGAAPEKGVELLATYLFLRAPVIRSFKGRERGAEKSHT